MTIFQRNHDEFFLRRNDIIDKHYDVIMKMRSIEKDIEQCLRKNDSSWKKLEEQRNCYYIQIEPLIHEYWQKISACVLSRCPFCEQDLYRLFDPVDLKGFWWMDRTQRSAPEPNVCEHFCLLMGAIHINAQNSVGGLFECYPGPDTVFAIPKILRHPTMIAVVMQYPLQNGYMAYPIAYFAQNPPPYRALTQTWAKKEFYYALNSEETMINLMTAPYDFQLTTWTNERKFLFFDEGKFLPFDHPTIQKKCFQIKAMAKRQILLDNQLRFMLH